MYIIPATLEHLDALAILFDRYRVFYQQASDVVSARKFLKERLTISDSIVLVALSRSAADASMEYNPEHFMGFTQLYPSFSSVSMARILILNDLYVNLPHRRQGVATALMAAAEQYARESGAIRVVLSTQISNVGAQALYQARGYDQDTEFYHYGLELRARDET